MPAGMDDLDPASSLARALGTPGSAQGPRAVVLDADGPLADVLDEEQLERARPASVAQVLTIPAGQWEATAHDGTAGGFGLLVLEGSLLRRVGVDGRYGAELLADGDLLRPWQHDGEAGTLPFETTWRVVSPVRLAVLDRRWAMRMAPFPEVATELAGRTLDRSRRLAMIMAIVQQPRLDRRLWLLFWEIADRFGVVRKDGIHIELPLTHEIISELAAARRPSVSSALGRLSERGVVRRAGRHWVITGDPPALSEEPGLLVAEPD